MYAYPTLRTRMLHLAKGCKADIRSLDFVVTRFFNETLQVNEY